MAKGQIFAYDFFVSVLVFTSLILIFNFTWLYLEEQTRAKIEFGEMQEITFFVSDILIRSQGNPSDWNETNYAMLGLAKEENILDYEKLKMFHKMNYSSAAEGTTVYPYNFTLNLSLLNSTSAIFCYPSLAPLAYHNWVQNDTVAIWENSTAASRFLSGDLSNSAQAYALAFILRRQGSPVGDLDIYLEDSQTSSPTSLLTSFEPANISLSYSLYTVPFSPVPGDNYFYFSCPSCSDSDNYLLRGDGSFVENTFIWNSTEWVTPNATNVVWVSYNISDYCAPASLPSQLHSLVPASRYVLLDFNNGTRVPGIFRMVVWHG